MFFNKLLISDNTLLLLAILGIGLLLLLFGGVRLIVEYFAEAHLSNRQKKGKKP